MGFERVTPGLQYDSPPMVSIYTDGSARINVPADREWFEDFDRVAVYADRDTGRLAFSPAPDDDTDTYALSRSNGKLGADVTTKSAVADLGIVDELDDTLNVELEKDDDLGLVVADVRAELDDSEGLDDDVVDQGGEDDDVQDAVTTDDVAAAFDDAQEEAPEPAEPVGGLEPAIVERAGDPTEPPGVPDDSDTADDAVEPRANGGAFLSRAGISMLDPEDTVACGHCGSDPMSPNGLKIHHGRSHKDLEDDELRAIPIEAALPGSLTDGDVASVAEHYDSVEAVAADLEVTEPRARAILASRNLLEEVTGGA